MKPSSLNDNIVYLCTEFSHIFSQALRLEFQEKKVEVTPEQLAVLVFLFYHGSVLQKTLSEGLNRDKTTITRVIMNMEKSRLIKQSTHPDDSRAKLISLTEKGRRVQQKALLVSGKLYTKTMTGLKTTELNEITIVLHKLLNNLNSKS